MHADPRIAVRGFEVIIVTMTDILCGQRSAEVDVAGQAKLIQRVDKIAFEMNHFLHDRVRQLFTSGSTPASALLKAAKARKEQGDYKGASEPSSIGWGS